MFKSRPSDISSLSEWVSPLHSPCRPRDSMSDGNALSLEMRSVMSSRGGVRTPSWTSSASSLQRGFNTLNHTHLIFPHDSWGPTQTLAMKKVSLKTQSCPKTRPLQHWSVNNPNIEISYHRRHHHRRNDLLHLLLGIVGSSEKTTVASHLAMQVKETDCVACTHAMLSSTKIQPQAAQRNSACHQEKERSVACTISKPSS